MPWAGFEPTIPVSERPQTHALDRAATEDNYNIKINSMACLLNQYAVEIFQRLQFVYLSLFK
jgi:hypothetical protein